ncbi:MAG: hypothetical protein WCK48_00200 [bacterium]
MSDVSIPKITPPQFPFAINVSTLLNGTSLSLFLFIFFVFYFIITCVLMYHWSRYGMGHQGVVVAETLFIFISVLLFIVASLSISYF